MKPSSLDPPLLFFSGKGGVGKTTVSLAYSIAAAGRGKKVLLALLSPTPWVAELFDVDRFSYTPTRVYPRLDIMEIDPKHALQEYLKTYMHIGKLAEKATQSALVTHFLDAVPGLNELLVLGKIYTLASEHLAGGARGAASPSRPVAANPKYDLIVIDAPATGHGLSLLQVPLVVKNAVPAGPLHTQTVKIIELFSDAELCRLCLVTLAEDMPVQETLDLSKAARDTLYMALGPVYLNALLPALPTPSAPLPAHPAFNAARLYRERLDIQEGYEKRLKVHFDGLISLPFLTAPTLGLHDLERLAEVIAP